MMSPEHAQRIQGTVLTRETPWTPDAPGDYEYPFPDDENRRLYERYRQMANADSGILVCGRLGEYRYYDMDHAIGRAMTVSEKILSGSLNAKTA